VSPALTILYEDHRGPRQGFGLHALVVACVFDLVDGERHHVESRLGDARPLKGVTNVLRACCEDIDLLAADGRFVVAVIDDDAIRRELSLPKKADESAVLQTIAKRSRDPQRLRVVLLHRNTESVLEAAAACDKTLDPARLERAIQRKDLLERDALFLALARERARPARDCILGRMPSMKKLVETVIACLRGEKPGTAPSGGTPKRRRRTAWPVPRERTGAMRQDALERRRTTVQRGAFGITLRTVTRHPSERRDTIFVFASCA
jgi:hypothetical protein